VDGIAGPRTAAAAQSFQADRCLGVDGIIGPITMSALAAQVTKVQAVAGTARDGGFGPNTRAAVTSWQLARSVAPVDGQAGSVTMGAMNIARTAPCSSPPPPPPNGNLGAAIASVATAELNNSSHNHEVGGYNCNYYSAVLGVGGTGSSNGWRTEQWCADFGTWGCVRLGRFPVGSRRLRPASSATGGSTEPGTPAIRRSGTRWSSTSTPPYLRQPCGFGDRGLGSNGHHDLG